jgi:hypothetical protein
MKSMEDAQDTVNALIPLAAKRDRQDDHVTKIHIQHEKLPILYDMPVSQP